ncbi:MAG: 1,6-anhydro-N-acetylmuramyl-L-alanine amidase AmpD [Proteobacteria bacterium]|jgi:N-acetyl-anhydromuramoyl-L-alanine amidase|nr:1,6-anhydro-N-acetylmuramyl-L-alanine amidase AmpD [Pseudomonadota bacterium]
MRANLHIKQGWIQGIEHVPSENHDKRPTGQEPEVLVIHCISLPPGEYGGSEICEFFQNRLDCSTHPYFEKIRSLRVSSHFLIERSGRIVQFVSTEHCAWHAGVSEYLGRAAVNEFSIGIELEGLDDTTFEDAQYDALGGLSRVLIEAYPRLMSESVVGHSDIASGRKTDPGPGFDWTRYKQLITNL